MCNFLRSSSILVAATLLTAGCASASSVTSYDSAGLLECDRAAGCKESLVSEDTCREEMDTHDAVLERVLPDLETLVVYLVRTEEMQGAGSEGARTLREKIDASRQELLSSVERVRACRKFTSPKFGPSSFGHGLFDEEIASDLCTTGHSKFSGTSVLLRTTAKDSRRAGGNAHSHASWAEGYSGVCWNVQCMASPGGQVTQTFFYCHRESDFYGAAIRFTGAEWELARSTLESRRSATVRFTHCGFLARFFS